MALVIRASTLLTKRILKVHSDGVTHLETSFMGGRRKFGFREIGCVLMSSHRVLSFQVGYEVFSVPTKPGNRRHQETIQALISAVRTAHGMPPGMVLPPGA
ncbi:hypothetical protein LCGC14_1423660 [marine sediment metagenome]|uniref:Uncharacterized protein n=1 Tax=marine sediment metagenome TaxID=412755 RepID=A0A0F9JQF3_9ZZZZ